MEETYWYTASREFLGVRQLWLPTVSPSYITRWPEFNAFVKVMWTRRLNVTQALQVVRSGMRIFSLSF